MPTLIQLRVNTTGSALDWFTHEFDLDLLEADPDFSLPDYSNRMVRQMLRIARELDAERRGG